MYKHTIVRYSHTQKIQLWGFKQSIYKKVTVLIYNAYITQSNVINVVL